MTDTPHAPKFATSFRLSFIALKHITALSKKWGVNRTSVLELAVRKVAESEFPVQKVKG
jgi:hypothetical protein